MRRDKINKFKKRNIKSKMRNVKITFKKSKSGGRKKMKRKLKKTLKRLKNMDKKELLNELRKNKIKAHGGSPNSVLRDILFYKETTGINIIKKY